MARETVLVDGFVPMHLELMREKSKLFPRIAEPLSVTSLRVWHCGYASIGSLAALRNLEVLVIASYPDECFSPLAKPERLRYLRVQHFPRVQDLAPLAVLRNLETLSLSCLPSWDAFGKIHSVRSFEPIGDLTELAHIELFGVRPIGGVEPLLRLKRLRSARFSKLPKQQISAFYAASGAKDDFAPAPVFKA